MIQVVNLDHIERGFRTVYEGCLAARKMLAELYQDKPRYNMHDPLSPDVVFTLDLYYRENIKNALLFYSDEEMELQEEYYEWLNMQGREYEIPLAPCPLEMEPWKEYDLDIQHNMKPGEKYD